MKGDSIAELAKKLNISKSTVSKAARHCSGVNSETRQLVLNSLPKDSASCPPSCDVYTILPDVPQYFWKGLYDGLEKGEKSASLSFKHNVYTRCIDESTVLDYLKEAEEMDVKVVIITTYLTPKIKEQLEKLIEHSMVILLSENGDLNSSFYIGADGYRDGCAMGKEFLANYADRQLVAFNVLGNCNAAQRLTGFSDTVMKDAPHIMERAIRVDIANDMFRDPKILSSRLAAILSSRITAHADYCLYSPVGMAQQLPAAFKKVCPGGSMVCMCHDSPTENGKPQENFHICCNQDLASQGFAAAKAAIDFVSTLTYPPRKYTYIPSKILKPK